jgi:hypothetical protein
MPLLVASCQQNPGNIRMINNSKYKFFLEHKNAPKEISFDGDDYQLVWADENNTNQRYEYLTNNETLHKWSRIFTLQKYHNIKNLKGFMFSNIKTYSPVKSEIFLTKGKAEGTDYLVYFQTAASGNDENGYHFMRFKSTSKSGLIMLYQFSLKSHKFEYDATHREVTSNKSKWLLELKNFKP